MSYARHKLARTVHDLATSADPVESRIEKAFGRHLYGLELHLSGEDEPIRAPLEAVIQRWLKIRQMKSTAASRARAQGIATELCNLAAQFPPEP